MLRVFTALGGGQPWSKEQFQEFVCELRTTPRMTSLGRSDEEARFTAGVMFDELGEINIENFPTVCCLVQNTVWVVPRNSNVANCAPWLWDSSCFKWVRRIVWEARDGSFHADVSAFDEFMDWVLWLNLVVVIVESIDGLYDIGIPDWMEISDELFTVIYIWEVLVKLSVKSWSEYWSWGSNKFDLFTTLLLAGTTTLKYLPFAEVQADLAQYANILRLMRLLRVVKKLKQYPSVQFMASTVVSLVSLAGDILQLMGVLLFFFSTFSVNMFGGVLWEGHPELEETEYAEKHWFVFNFNDVIMAFMTWFTQLLREFSPELAEALYLTSSWGRYAWYIYPCFYLVGVAILFEIFKAFTIETFLALKEEHDKENGEEEEEDDSDEEMLGEEVEKMQVEIISKMSGRLLQGGQALHTTMDKKRSFWKEVKSFYNEFLQENSKEGSKAGSKNGDHGEN